MAFKAPLTQSKEYKQVPAGSHIARIFQLIDLGVQTSTFYKDNEGNDKKQHKIMLTFEIPSQKLDDGTPMVISKEFTLSMSPKANLRKFIQDMLGIKLSDTEATDFDLETLIGKTAIVSVAHIPSTKDANKKYANVTSAMPLMDGMTAHEAVNKPLVFSTGEFNQEIYNLIPEWIQKKIALPPGININAANDGTKTALELLA